MLLRGSGCAYKKCVFCDYHLDKCADVIANYSLNKSVLEKVTGIYSDLEVINSGSVFELDCDTLSLIKDVCARRAIKTLHFEAHYMYRNMIAGLRKQFDGIDVKMKLGLETFDYDMREKRLAKGIDEHDPSVICRGFDEANFLFGISGQTVESMSDDISLGLKHFERICVNLMCENSTDIKPDRDVISAFMREIYPLYLYDPRVDILVNNTDFGVGD